MRVSEPVIKFITVRMDEEQKRLDKVRAIRATRKKLSAQPVAAAPVPDAPPVEAPVEAPVAAAEPAETAPVNA